MIEKKKNVFYLNTENTSYIFRITEFLHPEHIYYARRIIDEDIEALVFKHTAITGSSVVYDESDQTYCLDVIPLEYSGMGRGDFRHSPSEIKMPDTTYTTDFVYDSFSITKGAMNSSELPLSYGDDDECETLLVTYKDKLYDLYLYMYYTVYEKSDVITRRVILKNNEKSPVIIRRLMSMMIDLSGTDYSMLTLDGGWIKESHIHTRKLSYGLYVNKSNTGSSSNRHNPAIMLFKENSSETSGEAYAFNLVYSGNHYEAAEQNQNGMTRVMSGINPEGFEWELKQNEDFETPEAIMTYSDSGFNTISKNFHDFVNEHIIRTDWKKKERPIVLNSWESCFFSFNRSKLIRLAKRAKSLGIELFVMDDGWFSNRNDDTSGLGDYNVNKRKLPFGLNELSKKINKTGLKFGLWVEPEMVNENSDLYRLHSDWAVKTPNRAPTYGRHQLVLDLCNESVRDYITESLRNLLQSANISYVKWDMNRHISDIYSPCIQNCGEFSHRYILGLYDILRRVFFDRQDILLESCSSGGNRFDLGMLCFSPQIWASDNTDPVERRKIQEGLSLFYPQSCISSHVSDSPHQQTLRDTPISTRFNIAAFASLGYELDPKYLSSAQKKEVKQQIAFYKNNRKLFQYGRYIRYNDNNESKHTLSVVSDDSSTALSCFFQDLCCAADENDILKTYGLKSNSLYKISSFNQKISLKRFGGLINYLLPVNINPDGFIFATAAKHYMLPDANEEFLTSGSALRSGIKLYNQYMGTGYNDKIRLLSDFGSRLYLIKQIRNNQ